MRANKCGADIWESGTAKWVKQHGKIFLMLFLVLLILELLRFLLISLLKFPSSEAKDFVELDGKREAVEFGEEGFCGGEIDFAVALAW